MCWAVVKGWAKQELQRSDMSFSRAWASCRGPNALEKWWHDITMQMKPWSETPEALTNHSIPQTSNHHFPCQKTSETLVAGLASDAFHDLSTWHFHLPRLQCCVLFQPIQTTQNFPNLLGCPRHILDCPSLLCLPVTYLFLFCNSSDILFSVLPIRIKASHIQRICLSVSLTFGLEPLKALGQSLVCSWYSKHVCWPEAYNAHLQSEYNHF